MFANLLELHRGHLDRLTWLVRGEDWILECLHERLRQMLVLSIGPSTSARHGVMR
jgi:hypothetical protein